MSEEIINVGDMSASWLANQLDSHGVVRLRDVFAEGWLDARAFR